MSRYYRSPFVRNGEDYSDIEDRLEDTFWQVSPRETYVGELHRKLLQQMQNLPASSTLSALHVVVVLLAGVLSSFLIVALSIRVVLTLLTAIGLLYQYRRQVQDKRIDTIPPAL